MTHKQLAQFLRDTAEAHHRYELSERAARQNPEWTDADWPDWYARYMTANWPGAVYPFTPMPPGLDERPAYLTAVGDPEDEDAHSGYADTGDWRA